MSEWTFYGDNRLFTTETAEEKSLRLKRKNNMLRNVKEMSAEDLQAEGDAYAEKKAAEKASYEAALKKGILRNPPKVEEKEGRPKGKKRPAMLIRK